MAYTLRVSLPGYNALTDSDPRHYSLFADTDNILIKEKVRGSVSVADYSSESIAHGLSYAPLFMAFASDGSYQYWVSGLNIYALFRVWSDETYIHLTNSDSVSRTFKYYIFYDQT
ncbi:MAG: hypothetical protein NUV65_05765 [Candidatus Roizmanbacteria bacterium]|nr:hypothetical protein [Candidatus Roizmanbacteria bacterium]